MAFIKYPIGIQTFEKIRREGFLYVDKTEYVYKVANSSQYVFLSRPRRFGKSLFVSTLEAYFSGRRELFEGLAIAGLEREWTAYPVLHLDLSTEDYSVDVNLEKRLNLLATEMEEVYGAPGKAEDTISSRFRGVIRRVSEKTGKNYCRHSTPYAESRKRNLWRISVSLWRYLPKIMISRRRRLTKELNRTMTAITSARN